jgi:hypothetical protein
MSPSSGLPTPRERRRRVYDARMLAMADRLFAEFDQLPIRTVLTVIATSIRDLARAHDSAPAPDEVEQLARRALSPRLVAH